MIKAQGNKSMRRYTSLFLTLLFIIPSSWAQTLTIGAMPEYPPFSLLTDEQNHFYGFDIDVMNDVCKRIQLSCQFSPLLEKDLRPALTAGKIDAALMTISLKQASPAPFLDSKPYFISEGQFITIQRANIQTLKEMANRRIGVEYDTPYKDLARSLYKNTVSIVVFPDSLALLNALDEEIIDVALMNNHAAQFWFKSNKYLYKLIGKPISNGKGHGIMVTSSHTELLQSINKALDAMTADGTLQKIYARYFEKD